jgi:hypothetical protein
MIASKRKLGDPMPVGLVLNSLGVLQMADGSNVETYLKSVMQMWGKSGQLLVSILPRDQAMELETEVLLHRSHGA